MRHLKAIALVSLTLFLIVDTLGATEKDSLNVNEEDIRRLHGTWIIASGKVSGKEVVEDVKGWKLVVSNKTITSSADGVADRQYEFALDATKRPKHINLKGKNESFEAIYSLADDQLTLCVGDKKRPTEFSSTTNEGNAVWTFRRQ